MSYWTTPKRRGMSAECRQANAEAEERNRLRAEIERLRKLCAEASRALEDVGESANDGAYIGLEKRLDAAGRGEGEK